MKSAKKAVMLSVGVALLWASLATWVQGDAGIRGGFGSGLGKGWVQFRGHVLCVGCTLEEIRSALPASWNHLYQLSHRQGQVVMEVNPEETILPYHHLWLRGKDQVFATLAAEENLFKEVEVSGLLREYLPTAGTLDLAAVKVL